MKKWKKWVLGIIAVVFLVSAFCIKTFPEVFQCPTCEDSQQHIGYQMPDTYLGANIYQSQRVAYSLTKSANTFDIIIDTIPLEIHHGYEVPFLQEYWENMNLLNLPRTEMYSIGYYPHPIENLKNRKTEIENYMETRDERLPLKGGHFGFEYGYIDLIAEYVDYHAFYNYFGWSNYSHPATISEGTYPTQTIKRIDVKLVPIRQGNTISKNLYKSPVLGYYLGNVNLHGYLDNTGYFLLYEIEIMGKESAIVREMVPICEGILWDLKTSQVTSTQVEICYRTYNVDKVEYILEGDDGSKLQLPDTPSDGKNTKVISGLDPNTDYELTVKILNGDVRWGYPIEKSLSFRTEDSDIYDRVLINFDRCEVNDDQATIYWYLSYEDVTQSVTYRTQGSGGHTTGAPSEFPKAGGTLYFITLPNLEYNKTYDFAIEVRDRRHSTNEDIYEGEFRTQSRSTDTGIEDIRTEYGNDYIFIKYRITGEYTKTEVAYMEGEWGEIESVHPEPFGIHEYRVTITDLKPGTEYTVKIFSDENSVEIKVTTGTTEYIPTDDPTTPDDDVYYNPLLGFIFFCSLVLIVLLAVYVHRKKQKKSTTFKVGKRRIKL